MRIGVIDGQGGGMGRVIVEKLREEFTENVDIIALGTNALASSLMLKAGANEAASGENAIIFCSSKVDIIIGPIGIISANSMLGELTPKMAEAISQSPAVKILIPMNKCNIRIAGVRNEPLPYQIESAIEILKNIIRGE
ncbi:UNVERIFIED_CONTAM: uncharacterized protein DUF3842 [Acetivibrio alkalicellulosi]